MIGDGVTMMCAIGVSATRILTVRVTTGTESVTVRSANIVKRGAMYVKTVRSWKKLALSCRRIEPNCGKTFAKAQAGRKLPLAAGRPARIVRSLRKPGETCGTVRTGSKRRAKTSEITGDDLH